MMRHMLHSLVLVAFVTLLAGAFVVSYANDGKSAAHVIAAPAFVPPSTITVKMYQLDESGGKAIPSYLCQQGDKRWGCSAYCSDVPSQCANPSLGAGYPFAGNTVTVEIDGTTVTNRYLRDVVSIEMGPAVFHETAIRAQAIAARSYAYWWANQSIIIDNSNAKQVFVPRKFDTLTIDQQTTIANSLQDRYYVSQSTDDSPIFAEFSTDAYLHTMAGDYPYLVRVEDPISYDPAITQIISDTHVHQRGLSQNGSGRWARGSSSYRAGFGAPWSVSWPERFQILTHYYTGIHVRDANNGNAVLTPDWRGNVLQVQWSRPGGNPGGLCSRIEVWLQNSGIDTWYSASDTAYTKVGLGYCWNGGTCAPAGFLPSSVAPGHDLRVTLLVPPGAGSGELQLALYRKDWYGYYWSAPIWFSPAWPRQAVGTFSTGTSYCTRLPQTPKLMPTY